MVLQQQCDNATLIIPYSFLLLLLLLLKDSRFYCHVNVCTNTKQWCIAYSTPAPLAWRTPLVLVFVQDRTNQCHAAGVLGRTRHCSIREHDVTKNTRAWRSQQHVQPKFGKVQRCEPWNMRTTRHWITASCRQTGRQTERQTDRKWCRQRTNLTFVPYSSITSDCMSLSVMRLMCPLRTCKHQYKLYARSPHLCYPICLNLV